MFSLALKTQMRSLLRIPEARKTLAKEWPVLLVLCLSACGEGTRSITSRLDTFGLTVVVRLPAPLVAAGQALQWEPEAVPGARVVVTRLVSDPADPISADTSITDSSGKARFTNLTTSRYSIRVSRDIRADERAVVLSIAEIDALVGISTITIASDTESIASVTVSGTGGSSLVISEVFPAWPAEPSGQQYYLGGYIKIYNNADTTIQLARKSFIQPWEGYLRSPQHPDGCSIYSAIERDPANLWVRYLYRFPDNTRALAPGESALLVTDAIDHRKFGASGFFDLSGASAEFRGSSDVDNPLVPDMIDESATPLEADGHGWRFRGSRQVWALTNELKTDSIALWKDLTFGGFFMRVPLSAVLDLVRYDWDEPKVFPSITFCPSAIASSVDPADAVLLKVQDTLSIHRRIARTRPDGRVIYQRSHNSAADWIAGKATPGVIP